MKVKIKKSSLSGANKAQIALPDVFTRGVYGSSDTNMVNTVFFGCGWSDVIQGVTKVKVVDEETGMMYKEIIGTIADNILYNPVDSDIAIETKQGDIIGFYDSVNNRLFLRNYIASRAGMNLTQKILNLGIYKRRRRSKNLDPVLFLGSDPEFVFWNENDTIPALRVLTDYSFCTNSNRLDSNTEIGTDGHSDTGELRPSPSTTSSGLVENIYELLERISVIPYSVDVVGVQKEVGCHIHFGNPYLKSSHNRVGLVSLLDYYLGKHTIDLSGPGRGGYKRLGAYEGKRYGFEYRTFPGTIMADRKFFQIICDACHKIGIDFLRGKEFNINGVSATREELSDYVSDLDYFFDYIKQGCSEKIGKTYSMWGLDKKRMDVPRRVTFSDEWNDTVKLFVMGHPVSMIYRRFFGFAENKGDIISLPKDVREINGFMNIRSGVGIGLPRRLRINIDSIPELNDLLNRILDEN
jgi:hypothetical protein